MVEELRETLAVGKQTTQKLDVERFNLKKLRELEVTKQCQTYLYYND